MSQDRKVTALEESYLMKVKCVGAYSFEVRGKTGHTYKVNLVKQTCTCPDFAQRGVKCKHIWKVELDGYEGPKHKLSDELSELQDNHPPEKPETGTTWKPQDGFTWFNSMGSPALPDNVRSHAICMVAPGKKKDHKFWVALPDFPHAGVLTLCWGDVNESDLETDLLRLGQSKQIPCHSPFAEAVNRSYSKGDKGYRTPGSWLEEALLKTFARQFTAQGVFTPSASGNSKKTEGAEKPEKTKWKPDNDEFVWF